MEYSTHRSAVSSFGTRANGSDVYKRKAFQYFIHQCVANGHGSEEFAENIDIWQKKLQRSHGFPQKKQKLVVRPHQCTWNGCQASFETDRDCLLHMRTHDRRSQDWDSTESTGGSLLWLDSSSGNSAESNFDSDSSELSSLSTATSRSSSRTRNYEAVPTKMKPHNYSSTSEEPQTRAVYHVPTASMERDFLFWAIPRSLSEKSEAISPTRSTTKEVEEIKANVCDGNRADSQSCERIAFGHDNSDHGQSPFTSPGLSSGTSQPTAPSVAETDNPSENDSSSQSQTSSTVSDSSTGEKNEDEAQSETKLEDLVKNHVLRTDPEVAELFLRAVEGQLEVASDDNIEQLDDPIGLSLLRLLELPCSNETQDCPGLRSHAPSSSSGSSSSSSSSPDQGAATSSSSSGQLGSTGSVPMNRGSSALSGGPTQMLKGQKTSTKSGSSHSAKTQPLRCIHNALMPEMFCVNHETYERFRPCAGPGWNSIQHLKEHMQSHHTKKVKKVNSLQCSDCQDKFQNQEELKSHKLDVDCPIRCPDCLETFEAKAKRTDHQKEQHQEEETELAFREIDEAMWKRIKDSLKAYLDVVKKGPKGKARSDPELDSWVEANTPRYMIGRSSKTNPKLELGQWYTIFKTLAPSAKILEHPFYEYPVPGMPPRSDFIEERIIFINDTMVESRIQAHGLPPTDIQLQRDWYRGVLRESLQLAAHTVYNPRKRSASPTIQANESSSPQGSSGRSVVQTQGYNMSPMPMPHSQMGYLPNGTSGMPFQSAPFSTTHHQQTGILSVMPNGMQAGVPSVPGDTQLDFWGGYTPRSMSDGTAPQVNQQFNFTYSEELPLGYGQQQSDPHFQSGWPGQQGQQRRG